MKNGITILLVVLVVMLAQISIAAYDHNQQPQLAEDIIDTLMPVPAKVAKRFGNDGERVRLIYNVAFLKEVIMVQDKRIAALEALVGKLPDKLDVTDPENTVIGAIELHTDAINQFRSQIDTNTEAIKSLSPEVDTVPEVVE